jgi:hypothetical protein
MQEIQNPGWTGGHNMTLFEVNNSTYGFDPKYNIQERTDFVRVSGSYAFKADGRRDKLDNAYSRLFSTREEANAYLLSRFRDARDQAQHNLDRASQLLSSVEKWLKQ